jgi:diguanylate cyclase (GGDEF)-like protein
LTFKKEFPDIHDFLEYVCTFEEAEHEKKLYSSLEVFLTEKLSTSSLLIYSYPYKRKEHPSKDNYFQYFRNHWNRKKVGKEIKENELLGIFDKIIETGGPLKKWKKVKKFYLIPFGETPKQQLVGIFKSDRELDPKMIDFMVTFCNTSMKRIKRWKEVRKIESLIHLDDVTSLFNQRKLLKDLDLAIKRHAETKEPFTVLFIDIDHFKQVNDGHGHLVGTQLLADMAFLLRKVLRESDLIYRYGGDEFVMIVQDCPPNVAKNIGERILKAVEGHNFEIIANDQIDQSGKFKLTVSIGVAGFPQNAQSRDDIIAIADQVMYQAKESGRGRVCFADNEFEETDKNATTGCK